MFTRLLVLSCLVGLLALLCGPFVLSADQTAAGAGKKVANFTLTDPRDQRRVSLADFKDKKATVVVFLGTECPISNAFLPILVDLARQYEAKGVQFLAINANIQDTAARVAAHAQKLAIPFPVLKDPDNVVADRFGAVRTPEAFVLDAGKRIRYQGRIDDRIGIRYQRPQPTRRDLAEALDEVLAGKEVSEPVVPAAGCLIGRAPKPAAEGKVTYSKQVARILQKNCQDCHRPGQIGPMPLLSYDDASAWSAMLREVVEQRRMPPWLADPHFGKFSNDRSLTAQERDTLLAWVEEGCPKGDDRDLPAPRQFVRDWSIGQPDVVLSMPEEFDVPADTPPRGVPYKYFSVPTHFTEDRWVIRAEAKPGAPEVVHHIVAFVQPPDKPFVPGAPDTRRVLVGAVPGDASLVLPPGTAKKIPAGSSLVFQMHYTPNGTACKDRSSVGLIFAKEPPERESFSHGVAVANRLLHIPAGADNYEVESSFTFKEDSVLVHFMPHMHLRGKDFLYELIYPDGRKETVLSVPHYDFNWQIAYRLARQLPLPKGTQMHCVAHFDNSTNNRNNPDPTQEVRWGDQTWQEMMIGWIEYAPDRKPG